MSERRIITERWQKLLARIWVLPLFPGVLLTPLVLPSPMETYQLLGWAWLLLNLSALIGVNQWLNHWLHRHLPWETSAQRRFFVQLITSMGLSLLIINLSYYLFQQFGLSTTPEADQFFVLNIYGLILLVPLLCAQVVAYLFVLWKKSTLLTERLEQENIQTRLESLRSHLDPHFLFNSLNILSSLIDRSQEDAQEFLASFSDVYRYVLQNKSESVVPLRTEWAFLESYLHLLQVRFRDQLQVELEPPSDMGKWVIPPLALQMLVENAIKHNKASERQPLRIEILADEDTLIVKNNRRVHLAPQNSHGSGLHNLRSRYAYLSRRQVQIEETEEEFVVKLPLLERKEA